MPKLPDVTAFGSRAVYSDPIIKAQAPIARTGELKGRALMDVGRAMQGLAADIEKENARYDTVVAEDAFNKLREKQMDLTAGEDGYTKRRGADAADKPIMDEYGKRYDEQVNRIADGLGNDRQKTLLRNRAAVSGLEFRSGILNHVMREREAFEKTTKESGIQLEYDRAVTYPNDRSVLKSAMKRAGELVIAYHDKRGHRSTVNKDGTVTHSPVVEDELRNIYSKMNRGVIERLLVNDEDIAAEAVYKEVKGTTTAEDTIAIERALEVGSLRGKSLRFATELMDKHGGNMGLAAKEARTRYGSNPKLLDATLQRIHSISAENESIQKLDEDRRFTTAHDYAKAGKQIPATIYAMLSPEARAAFDDPQKLAIIQNKAPRVHNQKAFNDFMKLDRHDIAAMKEEDFFIKYYINVNDESARYMSQMRDWSIEAAKKDPKDASLVRNDISVKDAVKGAIVDAGLIDARKKVADYTQEEETLVNNGAMKVSQILNDLQAREKRKATPKDIEDAVKQIMIKEAKVKIRRDWVPDWFAKEKKESELTPAERATAFYTYKQVPITDRDKIRQYAATLGVSDLNDDRVAKAYTVLMQTKGTNISREDREARVAAILRGQ